MVTISQPPWRVFNNAVFNLTSLSEFFWDSYLSNRSVSQRAELPSCGTGYLSEKRHTHKKKKGSKRDGERRNMYCGVLAVVFDKTQPEKRAPSLHIFAAFLSFPSVASLSLSDLHVPLFFSCIPFSFLLFMWPEKEYKSGLSQSQRKAERSEGGKEEEILNIKWRKVGKHECMNVKCL